MADTSMEEHRVAARVENALFLMENGVSMDAAARRLGVLPKTLEKNLAKAAGKKEPR